MVDFGRVISVLGGYAALTFWRQSGIMGADFFVNMVFIKYMKLTALH